MGEVLLIFIINLFPLFWIFGGYMVIGHDIGFPLNPGQWIQDLFSVLDPKTNFTVNHSLFLGTFPIHALPAILVSLGFSLIITEALTFIFWANAIALSFYFFVHSFYPGKEYRFLRIFTSLFPVINFFTLTRFIIFERTGFSFLVSLPLILTFLTQYLQKKRTWLKTLIPMGITFFFFNAGGIPPFVGILGFMFGLYIFLFILLERRTIKGKHIFFACLILLTSYFLSNLYWILPFFVTNIKAYHEAVSGSFEGLIGWLNAVSASSSIQNLFKLQGDNAWYNSSPTFFANFYTKNILGILLSGLMILGIWPAFLLGKKKQDRFFLIFFSLIGIIFIFLAAGTHPPLGKYYIWMMKHIPFFAIYRTPFYKFSYGIVFGYAFLFGFTMQWFLQKLSSKDWKFTSQLPSCFLRHGGKILLIIYLGIHFVYVQGRIFDLFENFKLRIQVPSYIFDASEYMKEKSKESRVLLLPKLINNYGGVDVYRWGYWSIQPLQKLLMAQGILTNQGSPEELKIINSLYTDIMENKFEEVKNKSYELGIQYFLLRKDFYYDWNAQSESPERIEKILMEQKKYFQEIREFGEWVIYELKDSPKRITAEGIESTPDIQTNSFGTTQYHVSVKNASSTFTLILKNSFDPLWSISLLNKEKQSWIKNPPLKGYFLPLLSPWMSSPLDASHFKEKMLWNAWTINPKTSEFDLIIEYWPQKFLVFGSILSFLFLIFGLLLQLKWIFFSSISSKTYKFMSNKIPKKYNSGSDHSG